MTPFLAMAAGCIVIGYDGFAGREFMDEGRGDVVPLGDILRFVQVSKSVMKQWELDPQAFAARLKGAARFVHENYSPQRERESIVYCWERILQMDAYQQKSDVAAA